MKILVTGVAGFMGSHIAEQFVKRGDEVIGIDNLIGGYISNIPNGVKFYQLDLNDFDDIKDLFIDVDIVVHAACTAYEGLSMFAPAFIEQNTSHISNIVFSASIRAKVKKIVYMSSMARYGSQKTPFTEDMQTMPQDPYGVAKVAAENTLKILADTFGIDYVILVPHNIVGPKQKYDDPYRNVASIMINRMLQGQQPIIFGDGLQERCFSFYQDVLDPLMIACLSDEVNGKVINIGPDEESITILELAQRIAKILDFSLDPIFLPERPREVRKAMVSSDLSRQLLKYKTSISLDEGLKEMCEWIKQQGPKPFTHHLSLEYIKENTPKVWID